MLLRSFTKDNKAFSIFLISFPAFFPDIRRKIAEIINIKVNKQGPIGIFDSGYGGLTVFKEIIKELPQYNFVYLGDNARVPYGTRSSETVYQYTWESVQALFELGCPLFGFACNPDASKSLKSM